MADPVPYEATFVENLTRARKAVGMTQTELARRAAEYGLPFHQPTIQRIEAMERPVRVNEAVVLSEILRLDFRAALQPASAVTAARTLRAQVDSTQRALAQISISAHEARQICLTARQDIGRELSAYLRTIEALGLEADEPLTDKVRRLGERLSQLIHDFERAASNFRNPIMQLLETDGYSERQGESRVQQ